MDGTIIFAIIGTLFIGISLGISIWKQEHNKDDK